MRQWKTSGKCLKLFDSTSLNHPVTTLSRWCLKLSDLTIQSRVNLSLLKWKRGAGTGNKKRNGRARGTEKMKSGKKKKQRIAYEVTDKAWGVR